MGRFGSSNAAPQPPVTDTYTPEPSVPAQPKAPQPANDRGFDMLEAKLRVHAKLIDELDLSVLFV